MHTIFNRLGLQDLYEQLKSVVNSIGKLIKIDEIQPNALLFAN